MGVKARISPQIKQLAAEQAIELPPVEAAHVGTTAWPGVEACMAAHSSACAWMQQHVPAALAALHAPLSQVEAVLQTAVDKLAIIGMINVDPRSQALELTQHVGEEISRMITQQKDLESRWGTGQTTKPPTCSAASA